MSDLPFDDEPVEVYYLTAGDIEMMRAAMTAQVDEVDLSEFFLDDD